VKRPGEIERFLKAVDSALRRRVEVVVIGGAAASEVDPMIWTIFGV
jgi:hypothetical protein